MWPFSNAMKYNAEVIDFCRQWEKRLKAVQGKTLREKIDVHFANEPKLSKKAHWVITIRNKCAHDADYYVTNEPGLINNLREAHKVIMAKLPREKRGCFGRIFGLFLAN